jgi:hypothetical protein
VSNQPLCRVPSARRTLLPLRMSQHAFSVKLTSPTD